MFKIYYITRKLCLLPLFTFISLNLTSSLVRAHPLNKQMLALETLELTSFSFNSSFSIPSNSVLWVASEADSRPRLSQILDTVNQMEDSSAKVTLLHHLALQYIQLEEIKQAQFILEQCLTIIPKLDDPKDKVNLLVAIAETYSTINQEEQAKESLILATETAKTVEEQLTQGQLLLEVALGYDLIGLENPETNLLSQSQEIILEILQPSPEFPFTELPYTLSLGLVGNVNSFRDTTAFLGVNVDYYKQWSERDISLDGTFAISFDSGRDFNNYRPSSLMEMTYRRHFNHKWNFFTDIFIATNQQLFASKNDDEDLSISAAGLVGAGFNVWRGENPRQFLDVQLGVGPRYQYDFIAFEERKNTISPIVGLVLLGRNFQLGKFRINETFAIAPALTDGGSLIISSDTRVSFPINEHWSFVNRLFLRHRSPEVFEENPALEFFFTTGIDYQF